MGDALVHSYHFVCCSFLLTVFPHSNVASLQWGTVLHKVLQNTLEHKYQVLPMDCSSSRIAPLWVLPKSIWSCRNRLLLWVPQRPLFCPKPSPAWTSLHRLQLLPEACSVGPVQAAASLRASTSPGMGLSMGCGAFSNSVPGNTSSPSSFL